MATRTNGSDPKPRSPRMPVTGGRRAFGPPGRCADLRQRPVRPSGSPFGAPRGTTVRLRAEGPRPEGTPSRSGRLRSLAAAPWIWAFLMVGLGLGGCRADTARPRGRPANLEPAREILPERFDQPDEAEMYYRARRRPLDPSIKPMHAYAVAERQRLRMPLHSLALAPAAGPLARVGPSPAESMTKLPAWESLGPGNVGGRLRGFVIHPSDPDIMYVSGVSGGVWKTTDGGRTWATATDQLANITVNSLAMNPANPDKLYGGTGEGYFREEVRGTGLPLRGAGIFVTTDAGASWSRLREHRIGGLLLGQRSGDLAGRPRPPLCRDPHRACGGRSTKGCPGRGPRHDRQRRLPRSRHPVRHFERLRLRLVRDPGSGHRLPVPRRRRDPGLGAGALGAGDGPDQPGHRRFRPAGGLCALLQQRPLRHEPLQPGFVRRLSLLRRRGAGVVVGPRTQHEHEPVNTLLLTNPIAANAVRCGWERAGRDRQYGLVLQRHRRGSRAIPTSCGPPGWTCSAPTTAAGTGASPPTGGPVQGSPPTSTPTSTTSCSTRGTTASPTRPCTPPATAACIAPTSPDRRLGELAQDFCEPSRSRVALRHSQPRARRDSVLPRGGLPGCEEVPGRHAGQRHHARVAMWRGRRTGAGSMVATAGTPRSTRTTPSVVYVQSQFFDLQKSTDGGRTFVPSRVGISGTEALPVRFAFRDGSQATRIRSGPVGVGCGGPPTARRRGPRPARASTA